MTDCANHHQDAALGPLLRSSVQGLWFESDNTSLADFIPMPVSQDPRAYFVSWHACQAFADGVQDAGALGVGGVRSPPAGPLAERV